MPLATNPFGKPGVTTAANHRAWEPWEGATMAVREYVCVCLSANLK